MNPNSRLLLLEKKNKSTPYLKDQLKIKNVALSDDFVTFMNDTFIQYELNLNAITFIEDTLESYFGLYSKYSWDEFMNFAKEKIEYQIQLSKKKHSNLLLQQRRKLPKASSGRFLDKPQIYENQSDAFTKKV
jgi:hypothetical protein